MFMQRKILFDDSVQVCAVVIFVRHQVFKQLTSATLQFISLLFWLISFQITAKDSNYGLKAMIIKCSLASHRFVWCIVRILDVIRRYMPHLSAKNFLQGLTLLLF
jgi:hypothetical protein